MTTNEAIQKVKDGHDPKEVAMELYHATENLMTDAKDELDIAQQTIGGLIYCIKNLLTEIKEKP